MDEAPPVDAPGDDAPPSPKPSGRPRRLPPVATLTCPHCGRVFAGERLHSGVHSNYRRHLLTHSDRRPHVCPYCRVGFTTKQNLKRHVMAVHADLATPQHRPRNPAPDDDEVLHPHPMPGPEHSRGGDASQQQQQQQQQQQLQQPEEGTASDAFVARRPQIGRPPERAAPGEGRSARHSRAPPPFALPTSTATQHRDAAVQGGETARPENSEVALHPPGLLQCRFCGKFFAWKSTHALHEKGCLKRLSMAGTTNSEARAGTDSTQETAQQSPGHRSPEQHAFHVVTGKKRKQKKRQRMEKPLPLVEERRGFTCPDCELEVGTRSHLRRHQRYYCPFRDDALADPMEDAVQAQRRSTPTSASLAPMQGERGDRRKRSRTSATDSEGYGDSSADEADPQPHWRRRAAQLAAQAGLKYYDNADDSLSEGYSSSSGSGSSVVDLGGQWEGWNRMWEADSSRTPDRADASVSSSGSHDVAEDTTDELSQSNGASNSEEDMSDSDMAPEAWLVDRLHLDFNRRHNNRRRHRRILLRRLRARERRLDSEMTHTPTHSDALRSVTPPHEKPVTAGEGELPNRHGSQVSSLSPEAHHANGDTHMHALPIMTEALQQRARAVLEAPWQRTAAVRHTCPFDGCMAATFPNRAQWMAHARRVHPQAYAEAMQRRRTVEEVEEVEEDEEIEEAP